MNDNGNYEGDHSGRLSVSADIFDDKEFLKFYGSGGREEEIERKKTDVRDKVESQLSRAEVQTRHLAQIMQELEMFADPMRKEVGLARKRIDVTNRDLKSLGQTCQKKEKEYKEALEAFHEKSKEKAQLTATLVELVNESEILRMKKLEEISKIIETTQ